MTKSRKLLLLDEDGEIYEIHEHKKFTIEVSYTLSDEYETIYETNDVDDLINEFIKIYTAQFCDGISCHIKIYDYDSTGRKTLCCYKTEWGYEMTEWLRTELGCS